MIKTAILGNGLSATVFHLPFLNFLPDYQVLKVLTSKAEKLNSEYPKITAVTHIDEILNDPKIDLIINTLPNHLHYETTLQCLKAKKHVVVEKPFTVKAEEGLQLIKRAQENNCTLSVFHNRRWDYDFLILQEKIKNKEFGNISLFESYFDRFKPNASEHWRESHQEGSGVLYDLGPHLIDQCLVLFGSPREIFADIQIQRKNSKNHDYFSLILYYDNFRAILRSSSLISKPTPSFRIYGDKSSLEFPSFDPQEKLLKEKLLPGSPQWKKTIEQYLMFFEKPIELKNTIGQMSFYQKLALALNDNSNPPVSAIEAVNGVKIIELAIESSNKGVKLPYSPFCI